MNAITFFLVPKDVIGRHTEMHLFPKLGAGEVFVPVPLCELELRIRLDDPHSSLVLLLFIYA